MLSDEILYLPIRELGLPQTPPEQALQDAITWFRAHGFVKP